MNASEQRAGVGDPEQATFRDGAVDHQGTLQEAVDDVDDEEEDDTEVEIPDVDTLWRIPGTTRDYHAFEDCTQLQRVDSGDAVEKPVDVFPDADDPDQWCTYCIDPEQSVENGSKASPPPTLDDSETCRNDDPYCDGLDTLRQGRLPCLECLLEAPEDVMDTFHRRRANRPENVARVRRQRGGQGA